MVEGEEFTAEGINEKMLFFLTLLEVGGFATSEEVWGVRWWEGDKPGVARR